MSVYRVTAVRVFTFRWEESLEFYRDVVGFPLEFSDSGIGWAQFQLGTAAIGLERCDPTDEEAEALVGRFVGVSIEVDDIHAMYAQLTDKGVVFSAPPTRQPWGGTLAHFEDLDGNVLTLLGGGSSGLI